MRKTASPPRSVKRMRPQPRHRFLGLALFVIALACLFSRALAELAKLAWTSELQSQILLIPFVFAWLVYLRHGDLPEKPSVSSAWSILPLLFAGALWAATQALPRAAASINGSDHLALTILAFVSLIVAGGFVLLGKEWMRALAFPFGFLIFLVPLPDELVSWLETASQLGSVEAASFFFGLVGIPMLRNGTVFQLPGITIEVAQECSGIRSTLVLFITSLLVAHLFLRSPWRKLVLVMFVIPLGVLRNGFRILTIGFLCAHLGPQMIHSTIHRRGGPFFFALSLAPLFLLLLWLRRGETAKVTKVESRSRTSSSPKSAPVNLSAS